MIEIREAPKTCSNCGDTKPLSEFSPRKGRAAAAWCKLCNSIAQRERRKNKEYVEREKKWRRDNPDKINGYQRKYRAEDPHKARARDAVKLAIRKGTLERKGFCSICKKKGYTEMHHHSYKPEHYLDVKEVCTTCHTKLDNERQCKD